MMERGSVPLAGRINTVKMTTVTGPIWSYENSNDILYRTKQDKEQNQNSYENTKEHRQPQ